MGGHGAWQAVVPWICLAFSIPKSVAAIRALAMNACNAWRSSLLRWRRQRAAPYIP